MIALVDSGVSHDSRDRFLAMLPRIRQSARLAFRGLPLEEREELIAEVIADAYCAFSHLVRRGKADLAYATPLAEYAIRHVRAGRRVGQRLNVRDITSPYAQCKRGISLERLDRFNDQQQEWQEVLVEDKNAGPAETAAARIDFAAWLRHLSRRDRRIAKTLARGESTKTAAKTFNLSPARVSQLRRKLLESWGRFQGELALA